MNAERPRQGLYRSRDGVLLGVCRGLADHFGLSVFWVRFGVVLLFVFTGLWPVAGGYILAALIMKPEPVVPFASDEEREFYESYAGSRGQALGRIKRKFDRLDRRLRRLEDTVTSRDFDWDRRYRR